MYVNPHFELIILVAMPVITSFFSKKGQLCGKEMPPF